MNDIGNQNLRAVATQVSVVPSKPHTKRDSNSTTDVSGKSLPQASKPVPQPELKQPQIERSEVQKPAEESIHAAVAKMNEYTQSLQRDLQFKLDEMSGRTVVTVIDRTSKEVVRQIPDEVFLKIARNLNSHMELNVKARMGEGDGNALHLINTRA